MNPEFQRNLWLEATPRRITWAAVVLALVFGVVVLVTSNEGGMAQALGVTGWMVFVVCAVLWGARASGTSMLAEISDRTWDFQRLSALTPWSMTWGKMFGATSLAWLCGLVGLAVAAGAAMSVGLPNGGWRLAFFVALAVLVQALMLGAALIGVRKARAEGRVARAGGIVWGLIFGGFLLSTIAGTLGIKRGIGLLGAGRMFSPPELVDWWGLVVLGEVFRAVAVSVFAAWALAGAWRLMRLELQMRNTPLVWPGFLVFLAFFSGGFFFQAGLGAALLAGGFIVALCAYVAAFAEPADRVRVRQFLASARSGDLKRAAPLAPLAIAPVVLFALLVLAAFAAGGAAMQVDGQAGPSAPQALALLAFVIRDLGVVAYFRFGPRPQRGDIGAVLGLVLLYTAGALVGGTMGGDRGASYFLPMGIAPFASFASGLVQAAIAWALAVKRFRTPETPLSAPAPSGPASAPAS